MTGSGYVWPNLLAEDANFKTDHAVVGYLAARHWKMPDYVCQAVRWHHDKVNVNDKAATLVAILQTATHIYNLYAGKDDSEWAGQEALALEEVGVARDGQQEFVEEIHERVSGD